MKILILGGTIFLGRHLVTAAMERSHEVTIFHRGLHPSPFTVVREILGNRNSDLQALQQDKWDAVIDTSGYLPESVEHSANALKDHARNYLFISTISVYSDLRDPGITESSPLAKLDDPSVRSVTGETYGGLKVLCEKTVERIYGTKALMLRPGFIVGPYDPSGRFTYWPNRIREGGSVLVPEPRSAPMQFVDVRDLAEFAIMLLERQVTGIVNVTGPEHALTMDDFVQCSKAVTKSSCSINWIPEKILTANVSLEASSIPLWIPTSMSNMCRVDISKAKALGLKFRPLSETITDTLAWIDSDSGHTKSLAPFLSRKEEAEWIAESKKFLG